MNKWIKIFIVLLILGLIGGFIGYKFIYNKPHTDYEKAEPDFKLSGEVLFAAFKSSKVETGKKYNGKVLEISGAVTSVEKPGNMVVVVFAMEEGMFGVEGIRFTMLPKYHQKALGLSSGDKVTIKGYCSGYNDTDVILEKCSVINLQNN